MDLELGAADKEVFGRRMVDKHQEEVPRPFAVALGADNLEDTLLDEFFELWVCSDCLFHFAQDS